VASLKSDILTNDTLHHFSIVSLKVSRQSKIISKIQKFYKKIHGVTSIKNVRNSVFYFSRLDNALYRKMSYLVKLPPFRVYRW